LVFALCFIEIVCRIATAVRLSGAATTMTQFIARSHALRGIVLVVACALLLGAQAAKAGECPILIDQLAQWDQDTGLYADVWASGGVAYVGKFGDSKVLFFDIADPENPIRFLDWQVPSPNQFASAQEVKAAEGLLFIGLESSDLDGVEIVDVRDPTQPAHLTWITTPGFDSVHNVFYDNGFLYLANSRDPVVAVVDLTGYDPDFAPARITANTWTIDVGSSFVHDVVVEDGRLYAAAWNSGIFVYDVTNVATAPPVLLGSAPGDSTHSAWPSGDGRWVVTNEERTGGPVKLYEMVPDFGGSFDVILRDTYSISPTEANSSHNPVVVGNRVYVAWYQAGLIVLDIDPLGRRLTAAGQFDTSTSGPFGFDGAWGIYPFLGEDRILVSDLQEGLFVLAASGTTLSLSYPEGLITSIDPIDGATLTVAIDPQCDQPIPNGATVVVTIVPPVGPEQTSEVPLVPIGGDLFEAQLPGAPCGSLIRYHVRVETVGGDTVLDPPGAPDDAFEAPVLTSSELFFSDDFEVDTGWQVITETCTEGLLIETIGAWERGVPIGTSSSPAEDNTPGVGGQCFVTGLGVVGGSNSAADVDGGPVRLVSPTVVTDGQDVLIEYARWFFWNGIGGSPDVLTVEVSVDGGASWHLAEEVDSTGTQWVTQEFALSQVVVPGESVTMRFSTQDCPNNSITEAAIDDFSIKVVVCQDQDTVSPFIVHDAGATTSPFSGYIDPRSESSNGVDFDRGIDRVTIRFSEVVRNVGGADLDASAFAITSTGADVPLVAGVDATDNPTIVVMFDRPLPPGSWYTVIADVEDAASNVIANSGNLAAIDEADRIDIGVLPGDVDQNGITNPVDLFRFRQMVNGVFVPSAGTPPDFLDMDRDGDVDPLDLFGFRQLVVGTGSATQSWARAVLDAERP
jgi:hypothetical protein